MILTCKQCNTDYKSKTSKRKFCTLACAYIGRKPGGGKSGWKYTDEQRKRRSEQMKEIASRPEHIERIRQVGFANRGKIKANRDENHWNWKGDKASYASIHNWVRRRGGNASMCEFCHTEDSPVYDWSNKSQEYKRDMSDWQQLCRKCHQDYDDIKARSWITRKKNMEVSV